MTHKNAPVSHPAIIVQKTNTGTTSSNQLLIFWTFLLAAIGIGLVSFFALIHQSLRLDESQSLWQSSHTIAGLLHTVALDVHVPLYHLVLHYWIFYFGNSVVAIRLLSLIFFLATVPVIYFISRRLLSVRWSLFVVILFSFSPFLSWYGNEARMYTLLLLLSALNQLFFMRILKNGKGWFWYGLSAIIGAYSHYFFLFNLAAQGIYYLLNRKQFKQGTFKRVMIVGAMVLLALGPWLYYVYTLGSASGTRPNLPIPSTIDFFNVYSQFIFGFQSNAVNTVLLSAWPVVMLLALVAVRRSRGLTPELSFIAAMSIVPVLLAYAASLLITPFFLSRYMIISVAPLLILLVWLFSKYSRRIAVFVATLLIIGTGFTSFIQATSSATPVKEDYKATASDINSVIQPQDLVVLSAPFTIYPFEYYYKGSAQITTIPLWNRSQSGAIPAFNAKTLPADVTALNKNHRYIYLVLSQDQGYENTVHQYYLTHFRQVSKKVYSPDLTLYVYQVGYYTVPPIPIATITTQAN
ncbi:glycosyltransferase family 39 protein [Candidatus Saccharibacteria bacterium]|nr:glycosyltransferase family 39 protein [Candidatus Saccharibacteria bacterium]